MKFRKLFFAALCCLLLCACGNQKQISGRVTAYEAGILTVRTEKGKSYDFLVEPLKTSIFDPVSGEEEEALDSNCMVQVIWGRKLGQRTAEHIWIHAKLQSNAMQLSDGTPIDVWKYGGRNEYCLENGTALLVEDNTGGPENVGRWNELLYTEDFPEAAQQGIKDYYGEMGLRYDLGVILEDAWLVHGFSEEYNTKLVGQHVWLEGWNESIISTEIDLTIPVERTNDHAESFREGAVFDRKTGERISNFDLFTISPEELEAYLMDVLDADGTLDRENIQLNLKPEQIILCQDGGIEFCLTDRVDNGVKSTLLMGLSAEQAKRILHPWAWLGLSETSG